MKCPLSRRFLTASLAGRLRELLLLGGLLISGLPASANPGTVPPTVQQSLGSANLSGTGRFTWFGLKIYEARLWVGSEGLDPLRFAAAAFALELKYARSLDGKAIADSSIAEIEKLGIGSDMERSRWREAMHKLFPNVSENDRLVGIHKPGHSVSFTFNDQPIGAIEDPAFGPAFFAIWLDPKTRAPALRQAMLAGAARRNPP